MPVYLKLQPGEPGWLRQLSVGLLVSAQVMISRFHEFEPRLKLSTVRSLLGILGLPLALPLPHSPCLCLSRNKLKKKKNRGIWVAQSVKMSNLGSGHSLVVHEFEPRTGLWGDSSEP